MIGSLLSKIIGNKNQRELKRINKLVVQVNRLEESIQALTDEQIQGKTAEFRRRLADGEKLASLQAEAFAVAREASRRVMGMRHFDVQLIGGAVLHGGNIAEMRTGEGKTLVATLAAYLNALTGNGVHVVTVNDYLAKRDSAWMSPLYQALGLSVGVIHSGQDADQKRSAYAADITYGTNNEFGFDYLRDNMAFSLNDKVQRGLHYAIVDEVDSILIDEARTPLIISGAVQDSSKLYQIVNRIVPSLKLHKETEEGEVEEAGHFLIDEKQRSVELNEDGHELVETLLIREKVLEEGDSLYAAHNLNKLHHVHAALKAHHLFQKNIDYIVQNRQIVIVDEHTGRTMPGRRWGEGLHQAIEAKEGVQIQNETQTLASTTFQNYFRLYKKLSGMTGTADTEAFEFHQIYNLDVVVIPTNKPPERKDYNDLVYLTQQDKFDAIIHEVKECSASGRPVLVGTASIETSELLSQAMQKEKLQHNVLNAKHHANEAEIIAQAGRPGAVTIATNMAGRGTDIVLGGNWEAEIANLEAPTDAQIEDIKQHWSERHKQVLEAGGLHIVGTERHESRRIDNQLRGRSGRQGDPGSSRFFLSLEDNLMRIFASDRVRAIMQGLGMKSGEAIEHRMVSNAIEKAQRKVEARNFDVRKQLLEYDDVANDQRRAIYSQRSELLAAEEVAEAISAIRGDVVDQVISQHIAPQSIAEQWDIPGLENALKVEFAIELPLQQWLDEDETLYEQPLRQRIIEQAQTAYDEKQQQVGEQALRMVEKQVMLQVLDSLWKDHLATMDYLRQGIHLRSYAQKNPKQEYKREAFELFEELLNNIKSETIRLLSHVQIQQRDEAEELERQRRAEAMAQQMQYQHAQASGMDIPAEPAPGAGGSANPAAQAPSGAAKEDAKAQPYVRAGQKVGRNDPCPCGSGKKYKHCHGRLS